MEIVVFGKKGCQLCEAAKKKLALMDLPYDEHDLGWHTTPHDGWRQDFTVELMTAYTLYNTLPLIRINDQVYDYPSAMRAIKQLRAPEPAALAAAGA